jgi:hypothetical protein
MIDKPSTYEEAPGGGVAIVIRGDTGRQNEVLSRLDLRRC